MCFFLRNSFLIFIRFIYVSSAVIRHRDSYYIAKTVICNYALQTVAKMTIAEQYRAVQCCTELYKSVQSCTESEFLLQGH